MDLEQRHINKIISFLEEKKPGGHKCSVCQRNEWQVFGKIFQMRQFRMAGGIVIPCVMIVCTNCGNTHLFNAISLGIIDGEGRLITDE